MVSTRPLKRRKRAVDVTRLAPWLHLAARGLAAALPRPPTFLDAGVARRKYDWRRWVRALLDPGLWGPGDAWGALEGALYRARVAGGPDGDENVVEDLVRLVYFYVIVRDVGEDGIEGLSGELKGIARAQSDGKKRVGLLGVVRLALVFCEFVERERLRGNGMEEVENVREGIAGVYVMDWADTETVEEGIADIMALMRTGRREEWSALGSPFAELCRAGGLREDGGLFSLGDSEVFQAVASFTRFLPRVESGVKVEDAIQGWVENLARPRHALRWAGLMDDAMLYASRVFGCDFLGIVSFDEDTLLVDALCRQVSAACVAHLLRSSFGPDESKAEEARLERLMLEQSGHCGERFTLRRVTDVAFRTLLVKKWCFNTAPLMDEQICMRSQGKDRSQWVELVYGNACFKKLVGSLVNVASALGPAGAEKQLRWSVRVGEQSRAFALVPPVSNSEPERLRQEAMIQGALQRALCDTMTGKCDQYRPSAVNRWARHRLSAPSMIMRLELVCDTWNFDYRIGQNVLDSMLGLSPSKKREYRTGTKGHPLQWERELRLHDLTVGSVRDAAQSTTAESTDPKAQVRSLMGRLSDPLRSFPPPRSADCDARGVQLLQKSIDDNGNSQAKELFGSLLSGRGPIAWDLSRRQLIAGDPYKAKDLLIQAAREGSVRACARIRDLLLQKGGPALPEGVIVQLLDCLQKLAEQGGEAAYHLANLREFGAPGVSIHHDEARALYRRVLSSPCGTAEWIRAAAAYKSGIYEEHDGNFVEAVRLHRTTISLGCARSWKTTLKSCMSALADLANILHQSRSGVMNLPESRYYYRKFFTDKTPEYLTPVTLQEHEGWVLHMVKIPVSNEDAFLAALGRQDFDLSQHGSVRWRGIRVGDDWKVLSFAVDSSQVCLNKFKPRRRLLPNISTPIIEQRFDVV